ncbi:MAG TPA: hypothetical protein VL523_04545 [Terriglobia bacterium]|nr:hypothetical protein [Terriglobia bacterium]
MRHLNEEQLILYYYGEPVDRAGVEAHLAACERCRAEAAALDRVFEAVGQSPAPERPEDYGVEVWQRLAPRLRTEAAPRRETQARVRGVLWPRWAMGGAVAALVALAFLAGRFWPRHEAPAPVALSEQARDRVLMAAVADHMERAQILLTALDHAEAEAGARDIDIAWEQQRAQDLVAGNRLYEESAVRAGEAGLAGLLDDLGRVLLTVAHSPAEMSPSELAELRERIQGQGILFKIQVVDSRLRQSLRAEAQRQAGRLAD